jgi:hypothetical protein
MFGFAKVRCRGIRKNLHRLVAASAPANRHTARRRLLRFAPA